MYLHMPETSSSSELLLRNVDTRMHSPFVSCDLINAERGHQGALSAGVGLSNNAHCLVKGLLAGQLQGSLQVEEFAAFAGESPCVKLGQGKNLRATC